MGQVPASAPAPAPAPYGFVGDGRVSRHWRHYFTSLGIPWRLWSRRLARAGEPGTCLPQALADCEVLLLAVSDDAILPVADALCAAGLGGRTLVHFSGGRSFAGLFGAHPLMSFADELYEPGLYRQVPVFVERDAAGTDPVARFRELFPRLPNPRFALPAADKPLYHALCSLAGGMTAVLWQEFFEAMATRFHVPREALAAFPRRVIENVIRSPGSALTGPVARGDAGTIRLHLEALAGAPLGAVYEAFVAAAGRHS